MCIIRSLIGKYYKWDFVAKNDNYIYVYELKGKGVVFGLVINL